MEDLSQSMIRSGHGRGWEGGCGGSCLRDAWGPHQSGAAECQSSSRSASDDGSRLLPPSSAGFLPDPFECRRGDSGRGRRGNFPVRGQNRQPMVLHKGAHAIEYAPAMQLLQRRTLLLARGGPAMVAFNSTCWPPCAGLGDGSWPPRTTSRSRPPGLQRIFGSSGASPISMHPTLCPPFPFAEGC